MKGTSAEQALLQSGLVPITHFCEQDNHQFRLRITVAPEGGVTQIGPFSTVSLKRDRFYTSSSSVRLTGEVPDCTWQIRQSLTSFDLQFKNLMLHLWPVLTPVNFKLLLFKPVPHQLVRRWREEKRRSSHRLPLTKDEYECQSSWECLMPGI